MTHIPKKMIARTSVGSLAVPALVTSFDSSAVENMCDEGSPDFCSDNNGKLPTSNVTTVSGLSCDTCDKWGDKWCDGDIDHSSIIWDPRKNKRYSRLSCSISLSGGRIVQFP